jgi:hypothetical protein
MKKVLMFCALMLLFACNNDDFEGKPVAAFYYIKNTSNQTISFEVTVVQDEGFYLFRNDSIFTFTVNANDSVIHPSFRTWEDFENHPDWFTKFEINPVNGIQMNDPYLPENWVKYNWENTPAPAYSFTLNNDNVLFKHCECEEHPDYSPRLLDEQYLENGFHVCFFIDSIPRSMAGVVPYVPNIVYFSDRDETFLFGTEIIGSDWELPGLGKICNLPDFAKNMIAPEYGYEVYIEGSMYDMSCWLAIGSVFPFDYILTEFKIVGSVIIGRTD